MFIMRNCPDYLVGDGLIVEEVTIAPQQETGRFLAVRRASSCRETFLVSVEHFFGFVSCERTTFEQSELKNIKCSLKMKKVTRKIIHQKMEFG
ncbi:hypothetical protein GWI33_009072 [Rhynchophorus ferrugineus]|uniref:Uncharacterized protein n=1 Tax=Rhynchophorus ferrugineus TaxID=354439 RepID=A0A834IF95_RHYFE|nr:hypothetical protein GWI33_009072 [Rhynchophorus ferrugineus]